MEKNNKSNIILYRCAECGFHYRSKKNAQECERWCRKHKSCNLKIIAKAVENKKTI